VRRRSRDPPQLPGTTPHEVVRGSESITARTTILFQNKRVISFGRARIALSGRASEDSSCFKKRPMFGPERKVSKTGRRSREQPIIPTNSTCTRAYLEDACGEYILRVRWGLDPDLT
jgi:hypothetical protein